MNMKQTPKPLRNQAIENSRQMDSPLRRRSGINVISYASPVELSNTFNDDNEERRLSRRIEEESFTDTSSNLIQETEALNMCLQLHSDNKISKDNAWSVSIIDTWSKLIKKHHNTLQNFQIAGSTLEASTRVYSLRVDSVYNDVIRMSSELSRQSAKALKKKLNNQDDDDQDQDDAEKENNTTVINTQNPTTKTKKRKNISTVTKNKETLNCVLDTNPFTDPFFAKLNSIVGDINSSNRLMQNIIPTHNSILKLRQNLPFWDSTPAPEFDLDMEPDYDNLPKEIQIVTHTMPSLTGNVGLHQGLKGYLFSNDQFEEGEDEHRAEQDMLNHTAVINSSHMELQFDINAEVEPIAMEKSFVMDFGDMGDDDFDDLNGEDMIAINRCKGLQRQQIVIEDMQPECISTLEYSYRPLDIIDQFWAGPSHWKFRHSRKTHSIGTRASNGTDPDAVVTHQQKQKVVRKKKVIKKTTEITLEDILNFENINTLVPKTQKLKCTTITLQTLTKKWDSKKLKLPMDYKIPSDFFDRFQHAPNIHPKNNPNITLTPADDADVMEYNYDNENDRNYCSRVVDASDTETETDVGGQDHLEPIDNDLIMVNQTLDVIPDYFAGAPDKIEKINIAFSKRAKTVDMKQLKTCCWKLINDKKPNDECPDNQIKFTNLLEELPKVLSKTMAENTSMSLAFYSVLHLCNEKSLMLSRESENLKDFNIVFKF